MQAALIDCNIIKLWKMYFTFQKVFFRKPEKISEQGTYSEKLHVLFSTKDSFVASLF